MEELVTKACEATKTICLTNLKQDALGYFQSLTFVDLENMGDGSMGSLFPPIDFELRTAAPEIRRRTPRNKWAAWTPILIATSR